MAKAPGGPQNAPSHENLSIDIYIYIYGWMHFLVGHFSDVGGRLRFFFLPMSRSRDFTAGLPVE